MLTLILAHLVVIAVYACLTLHDEYRRQIGRPSQFDLRRQYNETMRDLQKEVQAGIWNGVESLKQEGKRLEAQQQRKAEPQQKYPELHSMTPTETLNYYQELGKKNGIIK